MIYLLKFIKITGSIIIYSPIFLQLILSHQYMLYLFFFDFIITDIIGFSFCMCDGFLKLLNIVPYLTYFFFDWFHWLITKLYLYSYLYCFFIYIKNLSFITLFIILFLISLLKYIFFKMYFEYFSLNLYFFYDFQIDLTYIFFLDLKKKILSFLLSDYILSFFMDFEVPRLPIDLNNYSYYIQLKPALDYHPLFYSYCIHPTARIYHHIFDRLSIYKEEYVLIMYFDKISDFYHTFIGSVYNPCILERNQGHKTVMYYYSFSQSRLSYGFSDFNFYLNRLYILNRKFCKVWDRKYYVDDYFIPERRILYSYFNLNRFVEHYLSTNFYNQYTHISYKNYFLNTFFKPKITYISTCYNISDFTLISYFIPFYICSWIIDTIWNPISKLLGMPLSTFDSFTDIMSISKPYTYDYYDLLNLQFYIKDFFFFSTFVKLVNVGHCLYFNIIKGFFFFKDILIIGSINFKLGFIKYSWLTYMHIWKPSLKYCSTPFIDLQLKIFDLSQHIYPSYYEQNFEVILMLCNIIKDGFVSLYFWSWEGLYLLQKTYYLIKSIIFTFPWYYWRAYWNVALYIYYNIKYRINIYKKRINLKIEELNERYDILYKKYRKEFLYHWRDQVERRFDDFKIWAFDIYQDVTWENYGFTFNGFKLVQSFVDFTYIETYKKFMESLLYWNIHHAIYFKLNNNLATWSIFSFILYSNPITFYWTLKKPSLGDIYGYYYGTINSTITLLDLSYGYKFFDKNFLYYIISDYIFFYKKYVIFLFENDFINPTFFLDLGLFILVFFLLILFDPTGRFQNLVLAGCAPLNEDFLYYYYRELLNVNKSKIWSKRLGLYPGLRYFKHAPNKARVIPEHFAAFSKDDDPDEETTLKSRLIMDELFLLDDLLKHPKEFCNGYKVTDRTIYDAIEFNYVTLQFDSTAVNWFNKNHVDLDEASVKEGRYDHYFDLDTRLTEWEWPVLGLGQTAVDYRDNIYTRHIRITSTFEEFVLILIMAFHLAFTLDADPGHLELVYSVLVNVFWNILALFLSLRIISYLFIYFNKFITSLDILDTSMYYCFKFKHNRLSFVDTTVNSRLKNSDHDNTDAHFLYYYLDVDKCLQEWETLYDLKFKLLKQKDLISLFTLYRNDARNTPELKHYFNIVLPTTNWVGFLLPGQNFAHFFDTFHLDAQLASLVNYNINQRFNMDLGWKPKPDDYIYIKNTYSWPKKSLFPWEDNPSHIKARFVFNSHLVNFGALKYFNRWKPVGFPEHLNLATHLIEPLYFDSYFYLTYIYFKYDFYWHSLFFFSKWNYKHFYTLFYYLWPYINYLFPDVTKLTWKYKLNIFINTKVIPFYYNIPYIPLNYKLFFGKHLFNFKVWLFNNPYLNHYLYSWGVFCTSLWRWSWIKTS